MTKTIEYHGMPKTIREMQYRFKKGYWQVVRNGKVYTYKMKTTKAKK